MSEFFVNYWWAIFGWSWVAATSSCSLEALGKDAEGMDRLLLRIPVFGDLIEKSVIARWTRTLSTMFAAGVPLVEALDSVGGASGNAVFAIATEQIQQGRLHRHEPDQRDDQQPASSLPWCCRCARSAKSRAALDHMFGKAADFYEDEVDEHGQGPLQPDGAFHHRDTRRAHRRHRRVDVLARSSSWAQVV